MKRDQLKVASVSKKAGSMRHGIEQSGSRLVDLPSILQNEGSERRECKKNALLHRICQEPRQEKQLKLHCKVLDHGGIDSSHEDFSEVETGPEMITLRQGVSPTSGGRGEGA